MLGIQVLINGHTFQVVIPKNVEACKNSLLSHLEIRQRGIKGSIYEFSPLENEGYSFWFYDLIETTSTRIFFRGMLQEQDNNSTLVTVTVHSHWTNLIPIIGCMFFIYFFWRVIYILIFMIVGIYGTLANSIDACFKAEERFVSLTTDVSRKKQ